MTRQKPFRLRAMRLVLLTGGMIIVVTPLQAQSSRVISIEEHWQLQLGEPDAERSAPQLTMFMSPTTDLGGPHFLFTLNHVSEPDYQPGGMQVQLWDGEELVANKVGSQSAPLQHSTESVSWVQRLSLKDGRLRFRVLDGQSATWSAFGGRELSLSVASDLTSLNGYRPSVSISESQVGYAENRVNSLTITKLVWVTDDGQVHEQNAPIPIDISLGD